MYVDNHQLWFFQDNWDFFNDVYVLRLWWHTISGQEIVRTLLSNSTPVGSGQIMKERLPSQLWTWHVLPICYILSTTTINHVEEIGLLTLNRTWHKQTNYDLASKRNFKWSRVSFSLYCCNLLCWQRMKRRDHSTICDAKYLLSGSRMWSKSPKSLHMLTKCLPLLIPLLHPNLPQNLDLDFCVNFRFGSFKSTPYP